MSTFQNISITKYYNNWYDPYYTPPTRPSPPSDPPVTLPGGTITADTLSFIDSDSVTVLHEDPPYYYWPAQKLLIIQFTTPNDGITHLYNIGMTAIMTGPTPDFPWPCPTCNADSTYTKPIFDLTFQFAKKAYTSGPYWSGPYYATDCYYLDGGNSYGNIARNYNNNPLLPNTTYRLYCDLNNNMFINPWKPWGLGDYFDYSANLYVYCADFGGGVAAGNLEMISEMN